MPSCTRFSAGALAMFVAWNHGQVCIRSSVDLLGVDVAIEVDDSHFFVAEMAADPTHRGETDRVVATENDREGAAREHVGDAFGDLIEALLVVGRDVKMSPTSQRVICSGPPPFRVVRGVKR